MKRIFSGSRTTLTRYGVPIAFLVSLALYSAAYYSIVERGMVLDTSATGIDHEVPPYYQASLDKVFWPIHVVDRKLIRRGYWSLPPEEAILVRLNQMVDAGIHFCPHTNVSIQVTIMHDSTGSSTYKIATEEGRQGMVRWLEANRSILTGTSKAGTADRPAATIMFMNRNWREPGRYQVHCRMMLVVSPPGQDLLNLLEAHGSLEIQ